MRHPSEELTAHIRTIANSIAAYGFLRSRALTVRRINDSVVVVDGHCRLAAVQLARSEGVDIKTLPCIIEAQGTSDADRVAMMLISNSGLQHSPFERAEGYKKLLSYGWTKAQVAARFGVNSATVDNFLILAASPEPMQTLVKTGQVAATTAITALRHEKAIDATAHIVAAVAAAKSQGRAKATARDMSATDPAPAPTLIKRGRVKADSLTAVDAEIQTLVDRYGTALRDIVGCWSLQEAKAIAEEALRGARQQEGD
jgi:ParB-like chromosome segregation protein Spo0J